MKKIYVTVYHNIHGMTRVRLDKTQEGQIKFLESLNKELYIIDSVNLLPIHE